MTWNKEYYRLTTTKTRRRRLFLVCCFAITTIFLLKILFYPTTRERKIHGFLRDWCRIRKARVNWNQILRPCEGKTQWSEFDDNGWDRNKRTDPDLSYISLWDIHPAGEFSRISIQSQTAAGQHKSIGGDSWRVQINGPSSTSGTVFDHANGTYEILFLVMEHGVYNLEIVLEYSLCDGIKDPPPYWFIIGSAQGKNQKEGVLGEDRPYLLKKLWGGQRISVTIPPVLDNRTIIAEVLTHLDRYDLTCGISCRLLWDGFGNWVNNNNHLLWRPFTKEDDRARISREEGPSFDRRSMLWVYGDSVSEQFFSGIRRHPLCTWLFRWCGRTYNWVYKLKGNFSVSKSEDDDKDFDYIRIINEIDGVISHEVFDSHSVILLNAGLHYLESTNFTNYQKLIDEIVLRFRLAEKEQRGVVAGTTRPFPGKMIWKTTTSLHKHKLDGKHMTSRRFLTSHRVLLYNAYATSAMCRAGFDVLDLYPLTDSYPHGTGNPDRPNDAVHYPHFVFESVERLLEHYLAIR